MSNFVSDAASTAQSLLLVIIIIPQDTGLNGLGTCENLHVLLFKVDWARVCLVFSQEQIAVSGMLSGVTVLLLHQIVIVS